MVVSDTETIWEVIVGHWVGSTSHTAATFSEIVIDAVAFWLSENFVGGTDWNFGAFTIFSVIISFFALARQSVEESIIDALLAFSVNNKFRRLDANTHFPCNIESRITWAIWRLGASSIKFIFSSWAWTFSIQNNLKGFAKITNISISNTTVSLAIRHSYCASSASWTNTSQSSISCRASSIGYCFSRFTEIANISISDSFKRCALVRWDSRWWTVWSHTVKLLNNSYTVLVCKSLGWTASIASCSVRETPEVVTFGLGNWGFGAVWSYTSQ